MFQGMLAIPSLSPSGVVALKFRRLDDGTPKYMAPPGQKSRIYNSIALSTPEHHIAICEGELDALILHYICGIPAVGIPGVQNWREWYGRCFDGFERVSIFADNDVKSENGDNPGLDLARRIIEAVPQARVLTLPANVDVNQLYATRGRGALVDLLAR